MHAHYFYPWCTMGGVERTLINRALVLRRRDPGFRMGVTFLEGGPALAMFRRALDSFGLGDQVAIADAPAPEAELFVSIDSPAAFRFRRPGVPFLVECHTTYRENQGYLRALPDWVAGVAVPSETLAEELTRRGLLQDRPLVLPNILPALDPPPPGGTAWLRRPVAYVGRLDAWKNAAELFALWAALAARRDDVFFLLAGPQAGDAGTVAALREAGLLDATLRLPAVPFDSVPRLLALLRDHRGLMVSASRGESFGWLAAEAIAAGLPVLLSDNEGHRAAVADDPRFLYRLGEAEAGAAAAAAALDRWAERAAALGPLAARLTDGARLQAAWDGLCARLAPPGREDAARRRTAA